MGPNSRGQSGPGQPWSNRAAPAAIGRFDTACQPADGHFAAALAFMVSAFLILVRRGRYVDSQAMGGRVRRLVPLCNRCVVRLCRRLPSAAAERQPRQMGKPTLGQGAVITWALLERRRAFLTLSIAAPWCRWRRIWRMVRPTPALPWRSSPVLRHLVGGRRYQLPHDR